MRCTGPREYPQRMQSSRESEASGRRRLHDPGHRSLGGALVDTTGILGRQLWMVRAQFPQITHA
jgi:hypothetical protein